MIPFLILKSHAFSFKFGWGKSGINYQLSKTFWKRHRKLNF